mgnify:CR=1 FL=1|tara:strand:- start:1160 stop:2446 length:1287 start_codon:yes stop_codon:yes gene_type:complete
MPMVIQPTSHVTGKLRVPGDKSISHRYAILAALAEGTSTITNYAPGADCSSTLRCLETLGTRIERTESADNNITVTIKGKGLGGLKKTTSILDAGNSGTTMRLLAGVLAGHPFKSVITGDNSLNKRPMKRIVSPLEKMGARIITTNGCAPITIHGTHLKAISFTPPVASAQVKSAVLLAGLHAEGITSVNEGLQTRDHTERALPAFGVKFDASDSGVKIESGQQIQGASLQVPGDLSSAAFWAVAAAALPGSDIELVGVGLNPTRIAFLNILGDAGAIVNIQRSQDISNEPFGDIRIKHGQLRAIKISREQVPSVIDELPALASFACFGGGLEVTGASELRSKESDRIAVLTKGLRSLGGNVHESSDGFKVFPNTLIGGTADAAGDHRMAMAFAIAALGANGPTTITGHEAVDISYPRFFETLQSICQ